MNTLLKVPSIFQLVAVVALELILHHVIQVVCVLASQTLKVASALLVRQGFMIILIATVRIKIIFDCIYCLSFLQNFFQLVDVVALAQILHHAHRVVCVLARQIFMVTSAHPARLVFMTILIAMVRFKILFDVEIVQCSINFFSLWLQQLWSFFYIM